MRCKINTLCQRYIKRKHVRCWDLGRRFKSWDLSLSLSPLFPTPYHQTNMDEHSKKQSNKNKQSLSLSLGNRLDWIKINYFITTYSGRLLTLIVYWITHHKFCFHKQIHYPTNSLVQYHQYCVILTYMLASLGMQHPHLDVWSQHQQMKLINPKKKVLYFSAYTGLSPIGDGSSESILESRWLYI